MDTSVSPPLLNAAKAISLLKGLVQKADDLRPLASRDPSRIQWRSTSRGLLVAAFGPLDEIVSSFDRSGQISIVLNESPEKRQQRSNRHLDGYVAILRSALEQLEWHLPADSQHFIPSGSQHDAYQQIRKIIQSATTDLFIVDNYVDGSTWQLLTNISLSTSVRILTMMMKADFALEGKHFIAQHGNSVEVRKIERIHDRFILADSNSIWHLGCSIKDAGSKTAFMSQIESLGMIAAVIQEISGMWDAAAAVTL